MMNKKLFALLVAIATVNASTFALLDRVVGGTLDTTERVVTAPVDALPSDQTWSEKREERRLNREERQENRENRPQQRRQERQNRRDDRYYASDY
jgi:hypothetical protein